MPAAELFREPLLCLLQLGLKFRLCPCGVAVLQVYIYRSAYLLFTEFTVLSRELWPGGVLQKQSKSHHLVQSMRIKRNIARYKGT